MNNNKNIFLNIVYIVWWISLWNILDYIINLITDEQNRILVYFGVALISLYIMKLNNVSLKINQ